MVIGWNLLADCLFDNMHSCTGHDRLLGVIPPAFGCQPVWRSHADQTPPVGEVPLILWPTDLLKDVFLSQIDRSSARASITLILKGV